jgi:hypothetical protein
MKSKKLFLMAVIFLLVSSNAYADLTTRGTGTMDGVSGSYKLIYDEDLDITWLDYTNEGANWSSQINWVTDLEVTFNGQVYSDWRLPDTDETTISSGNRYDGSSARGYNVTSSEMGHLFFEELGNFARYDTSGNSQSGYGLQNTGDFENLVENYYWSTQYVHIEGDAWYFCMDIGYQAYSLKRYDNYGLAVMDGDVSAVPIPGAVWLLGTGLLGLVGMRKRKY